MASTVDSVWGILLFTHYTSMLETQFWSIIDTSRASANDCDSQIVELQRLLGALSPAELIEFDYIFRQKVIEAYRWDLWGIAYLINGGCSDDAFEYFRYWLIGRGETAYRSILANPEAILDYLEEEDDPECEGLIYASQDAYETLTGIEMPRVPMAYPQEPTGARWEEEDLLNLFPQVAAKYW